MTITPCYRSQVQVANANSCSDLIQLNTILPHCARSKASHEYSTETKAIHSHNELAFSTNVCTFWKKKSMQALTSFRAQKHEHFLLLWNTCTQNNKCICFLCEKRAHKTTNAFAASAKCIRSACNRCLLYTLRLVRTVPPPHYRQLVLCLYELLFKLSYKQVGLRWCHPGANGCSL